MTLTMIIILVLALYGLQIFVQETSRFGFDVAGIVGNRDTQPEMSVLAARLDRAKNNMLESLPVFLALALLALIKGTDSAMLSGAALVFLIARAGYVPAYASGIPLLRSLFWLAGTGSLIVMAFAILQQG
ncbi:MAPEG family protein [uncultured Maricaulis sp.]|uniref:MAPEG family protein n=1 Tax=uncultured Maricaulis sp. TaxID=174710 RepID=UPI0030D93052|tara:strand:+ start:7348 stop:7737 length:390 start_codon:yes stop_codon:yes gene_type:complete